MHNYSDLTGLDHITLDQAIPQKRPAVHYGDEEANKTSKRTRDEAKPDCTKCRTRGETCEWDTGITFRLTGLDADHPSMLQAKAPKQSSQTSLKIVDVKFHKDTDTASSTLRQTPAKTSGLPDQQRSNESSEAKCATPATVRQDDTNPFLNDPFFEVEDDACLATIFEDQPAPCSVQADTCENPSGPKCQSFPYENANPADVFVQDRYVSDVSEPLFDHDEPMGDYARSASDASCETGGGSALWSVELSGSSATSTSSQSHKPDYHRREIQVFEDGLTHLDSLDYLMSNSAAGSLDVASNDKTSPTADDARGRLCEQIKTLVRQVEVSQQASKGGALGSASALKGLELNDGYRSKGIRLLHQPLAARPLGCTKLLKRRQLELWRNYSQSIAPWLDVCGSKRHFQHSIPLLAKGADYLHYAVLAASSRHLELQDTGEQGSESAGLYADAVQLLLPEMHTLDTPAIAACILLCVTELMNNPPQSCQPSLEACAAIMEASDVNVRSSGIQQSLFWAFANLTIANGSMEARAPVVSMRQFYPTESLSTATSYVRAQTWGEGYAKYAVFLTSGIASVVANGSSNAKGHQGSTELLRWKVLFDLLEDWHHCRPEVMQALMSYPSILDDYRHPFPMVLYDCAAAVVGNLLYHAAAISLLQQKPHTVELPKNQKSLLWHARQICGIVAENHERGVWPYVLQPLWTAGKVISNGVEREKIVEMLGTSQRECAWSTEWYITDLKRHWGTN